MLAITTGGGLVLTTSGPNPKILVTGGPAAPLKSIIPSYLYQQYADDNDLQAFIAAYNSIAQGYLGWFNQTPLSVYTNANIAGALLDWIATGIYGIERPVFSSLTTRRFAGLNSAPINTVALDAGKSTQSGTATSATDDYYKRVLTWWLYVGDGRNFNVNVLRKKVARFLYGLNGTDVTLAQAQSIHIASEPVFSPTAPTLSATAGGSIAARVYGAQATYANALGETFAGPPASLSVAANNVLVQQSPQPMNGATGWYPYVNVLSTNPTHFKAGLNSMPINTFAINGTNKAPVSPPTRQVTTAIAIGTSWTEPTSGLVVGAALPTANTSNPFGNFIITVPATAGAAAQFFKQAFQQNLLSFPFQLTGTVVIA